MLNKTYIIRKRLISVLIGTLLTLPIMSQLNQGSTIRTIRLTIWADKGSSSYGKANVYYGGRYMGTITSWYSSSPGVNASGCVSFDYVYDTNDARIAAVIRIESNDGYIWHTDGQTNGIRLVGNNGGTLRAYCRGERESGYSSNSTSSSSSNYNSSSSSSSGSYSNRTAEKLGTKIGTTIGNGITSTTNALRQAATANADRPSYTGYRPGGFSLSASVSAAWGENLELRFRYGGIGMGGDLTVMVGYDWIRGDGVLWNIGAGFVYGDELDYQYLWDVGVGFKFGRSYNAGLSFMLDANTTHLVGPKHVFGFTAGVGIGYGSGKGFIWDARAGIVIYFLQWDWL